MFTHFPDSNAEKLPSLFFLYVPDSLLSGWSYPEIISVLLSLTNSIIACLFSISGRSTRTVDSFLLLPRILLPSCKGKISGADCSPSLNTSNSRAYESPPPLRRSALYILIIRINVFSVIFCGFINIFLLFPGILNLAAFPPPNVIKLAH